MLSFTMRICGLGPATLPLQTLLIGVKTPIYRAFVYQ